MWLFKRYASINIPNDRMNLTAKSPCGMESKCLLCSTIYVTVSLERPCKLSRHDVQHKTFMWFLNGGKVLLRKVGEKQ